jgi:hypothetical protein
MAFWIKKTGIEKQVRYKLPPGAGAELTNCGSGSLLFIKDLKKFLEKKIMVA